MFFTCDFENMPVSDEPVISQELWEIWEENTSETK